MATIFKPEKATDVLDAVAWAASEHKPLKITGGGSKDGIGRPIQLDHGIDLSGLSGITLYEPEELVLSAKAGTPLAEIEAVLAENNQQLAFEPPSLGQFFGLDRKSSSDTIGGVIAANQSGPRRLRVGAARDHFLGFHMVTGRGQAIKSGGRVMKNVTGYDLCKGLAGSWGTLGVMTDVTMKVLPAGETETTLMIFGLDPAKAAAAMARAMGSSADVSGAAHLPPAAAARSKVTQVKNSGTSVTVLRLEGFAASVRSRLTSLMELLKEEGELSHLKDSQTKVLWTEIRDLLLFPGPQSGKKSVAEADQTVVWKISTSPGNGHKLVTALSADIGTDVLFDWAGGLVWLSQPAIGEGNAKAIRAVLESLGGHATLYRGPTDLRTQIEVFQPLALPVGALTNRVKAAFDPHGVLNPGRMYARV